MKVSFQGKIRKVTQWPASMDELRNAVTNEFAERAIIEEFDQNSFKMS